MTPRRSFLRRSPVPAGGGEGCGARMGAVLFLHEMPPFFMRRPRAPRYYTQRESLSSVGAWSPKGLRIPHPSDPSGEGARCALPQTDRLTL